MENNISYLKNCKISYALWYFIIVTWLDTWLLPLTSMYMTLKNKQNLSNQKCYLNEDRRNLIKLLLFACFWKKKFQLYNTETFKFSETKIHKPTKVLLFNEIIFFRHISKHCFLHLYKLRCVSTSQIQFAINSMMWGLLQL